MRTITRIVTTTGAALAGCALAFALASAQIPAPNTGPQSSDQDFINQAMAAGIAEVREGQLALQKSHNAAIRAFANQMIADHAAGNTQLAAIADQKGLKYPTTVDAQEAASLSHLRSLSGTAFDRAYAQEQVPDHQQAIALFQKETGDSGGDLDIRATAGNLLPTLQHHLQMAQALAGSK
ncbi:MAG: DUF4142 domain-containing protein [Candidatus Eremiobacteraeota bacterium]|nr:DUF4142 domain-containing protein [Candidatus Eremiobacteraeota bacterium]